MLRKPRTPPHLPFLSGEPDFAPNMKPIAPEQWVMPDTEAGLWLNNKRLLMKLMRDQVSAGDLDGQAAQELLYKLIEETGEIPSQNMPTALEEAASLVSDDLCILVEDRPGDWRLSAGVLCAPTYWRLPERIGLDLGGLHGPVPGGDPGLSARIGRIFTGLRPGRVLERFNWTVQVSGERFTPERPSIAGASVQDLYLRVERQTVRKLIHSRAVVFTIRICTDPLVPILENPEWREAFEDSWIGAPETVRRYKGWDELEPLVRGACRGAAFAL
ncbi:MAG: heme-dependent oxidative N-demethylase subunit alpha family protein [Pseudomonadota bacterium]